MYEAMIERVKMTHLRLRQQALASVFREFDGQIMKLDEDKRLLKYRKMAESPFSFYRGSAYLFYLDVTREWFPYHTPAERPTWIQGDLHVENFGAFRNEAGELVYDINDFDEGYLGSYLYDLLRMSGSIALVGQQLQLSLEEQTEAVEAYIKAYYKQIHRFAKEKDDPSKLEFDEDATAGSVRKLLQKLKKRDAHRFLLTVTEAEADKGRRFIRSEELLPAGPAERDALAQAWPDYRASVEAEDRRPADFYRIRDMALKIGSGTASIGLKRYYLLIEGGKDQGGLDDVVLEAKEVRVPVPAYFLPYQENFWQQFRHQGKRVAVTQQAMHHKADPFLGYMTIDGKDFYVRERSPYKKKLQAESFEGAAEFLEVLELMGRITAKIHSRADADVLHGVLPYHSEMEISEAMGESCDDFCGALSSWALSYSRQVEEDYKLFTDWVEKGCPAE